MGKAYRKPQTKDSMAQIQKCLDCKRKECNNCIFVRYKQDEYIRKKENTQNECLRSKT